MQQREITKSLTVLTETTPEELEFRQQANRQAFVSACKNSGGTRCPDEGTLDRWFKTHPTDRQRRMMALREPTTLMSVQNERSRHG